MTLLVANELRLNLKSYCMGMASSIYLFSGSDLVLAGDVDLVQEDLYSFTSVITVGADDLISVVITRAVLMSADGVVMLIDEVSTPKPKGASPLDISLKLEF
jgi:hypothetical protein